MQVVKNTELNYPHTGSKSHSILQFVNLKAKFNSNIPETKDQVSFSHSAKTSITQFAGQDKLKQYEALPEEEKQRILDFFKYIEYNSLQSDLGRRFYYNGPIILTLMGKKPTAYLEQLNAKNCQTIKKYKYLLESEDIKFITNDHRNFMFNVPQLKKVVNNNLAFNK